MGSMQISVGVPGRYLVSSRAMDSFEMVSSEATCATEKVGFRTYCVCVCECVWKTSSEVSCSRERGAVVTLMSSREGSMIS